MTTSFPADSGGGQGASAGYAAAIPRLSARGYLRAAVLVLIAASFYTVHRAFGADQRGQPIEWAEFLGRGLIDWGAWLPLLPLIAALCRRHPVMGDRAASALAIHAVAATGLAIANTALSYAAARIVGDLDVYNIAGMDPIRAFIGLIGRKFELNVIVYLVIVGTFHAIAAHRVAQDRQTLADRAAAGARQARLEALHAQLNPHYVYNALNTVAELTYSAPEQARMVAGKLARLLRSSDAPSGTVPLADELSRTEDYLQIESVRFIDRLTTRMDVPTELLAHQVPPYAVQTLAENAIRHGLARTTGPFRIELTARAADGMMTIELLDTGRGPGPSDGSGGVGLSNLRERLAILYGDRASFDLVHGPQGTVASIRVPVT